MWRWTEHPQTPGMGAAGSLLMANQASLSPSPVLSTLLEVALSYFLSFFRVARGAGGSVLGQVLRAEGLSTCRAGPGAELPSHAGALELLHRGVISAPCWKKVPLSHPDTVVASALPQDGTFFGFEFHFHFNVPLTNFWLSGRRSLFHPPSPSSSLSFAESV